MSFFGLLIAIIFGVLLPLFLVGVVFVNFIADLMGAPFVPTSGKLISLILKKAKLKKDQVFVELGSGDGRIVRGAVLLYGVKGTGIEFHPLLYFYSKLVTKFKKIKYLQFKRENFFKSDLSNADIIFTFLLPKTLKKLRIKFENECKKGTLVISHGFRIESWEKNMVDKIDGDPFPTYYYRIKGRTLR